MNRITQLASPLAVVLFMLTGCEGGEAAERAEKAEAERDEAINDLAEAEDRIVDLEEELAELQAELAERASDEDGEPQADADDEPGTFEFVGIGDNAASASFPEWNVTADHTYCINGYGPDEDPVMAQGQFCIVEMRIERTGDDPGSIARSDVDMIDSEGRTHSGHETWIDINFLLGTGRFLDQLNPGQSAEGIMIFDITREVTPTKLRVQPSFDAPPQDLTLPDPVWKGRGDPDW